jgi:hypothetical protein
VNNRLLWGYDGRPATVAARDGAAGHWVLQVGAGGIRDGVLLQTSLLAIVWPLKEHKGSWLIRRLLRIRLKEDLSGPLSMLRDIAGRVGKVAEECKMEIDVDEYVSKFRPDIMEVVFAWCKGAKFAEVGPRLPIARAFLSRSFDCVNSVRSESFCSTGAVLRSFWGYLDCLAAFLGGRLFQFEVYPMHPGLLDSLFRLSLLEEACFRLLDIYPSF